MKNSVKHKKLNFLITVLTFVLLLVSCGVNKNSSIPETSIESTPKIIFLNYSIKKTPNNSKTIEFLSKKVSDGKLKEINTEKNGVLGDLVCAQLDKKSNILQHFVIKNPLKKHVEYIDDSKSFQRKQIDLENTQFTIRLQLLSATKYISISNFDAENNNLNPLIQTKVN